MSRVFTADNCGPADVHVVDTQQVVRHVLAVDIDRAELLVARYPLRLVGSEVDTFRLRFRAIHPIYGGRFTPILFHCYGPQPS